MDWLSAAFDHLEALPPAQRAQVAAALWLGACTVLAALPVRLGRRRRAEPRLAWTRPAAGPAGGCTARPFPGGSSGAEGPQSIAMPPLTWSVAPVT